MKCCSASEEACKVSSHNIKKILFSSRFQKYEEQINKAIEKKDILWINYANQGEHSKLRIRPLRIEDWLQKPVSFKAHCLCKEERCDSTIAKTFNLIHVHDVLDGPPAQY